MTGGGKRSLTPPRIGRLPRRRSPSTRTQGLANAYRNRIADAIRGGYPILAAALGDDAFDRVVADYLVRFPSTRLTVRGAGAQLPEFLAATPAYPVWHGELALLDRAHTDVLEAAEVPIMASEQTFSPSLPLRLVPAHAFVELTTTVDELWFAIAAQEAPERPRELDWPRTVLVWRAYGGVQHRTLEADEAAALQAAARGTRLAEVAATFAGVPNPTARAIDVVLRWIADGVLLA